MAVVPILRYVETSRQVGVADDDVQPAVLLGVGVRLVPGVDDGPLERGLEADLGLEEVGALAEIWKSPCSALFSAPDLAGAGEHLAGDEEGLRCWTMRANGTSRAIR